jgi:hypothetical protein
MASVMNERMDEHEAGIRLMISGLFCGAERNWSNVLAATAFPHINK